jgi:hypothetical protein
VSSIATVPITKRRWQVEDRGSELLITIPRKWNLSNFLIVSLLLGFGVFVISEYPGALFKAAFVLAFILALKTWLWLLVGVERISISSEQMATRSAVFGLSWTKRIRFADLIGFGWDKESVGRPGHPSRIVILKHSDADSIFGTHLTFADDVSKEEASNLVEAIRSRFPSLANYVSSDLVELIGKQIVP